jgi:phage tail-like protein
MSVTLKANSLSTVPTDPLRNFKFQVDITPHGGSVISAGFMTVQGLSANIDVIPYREGGMNVTTQKMPGQADFNPITLSRGVIVGSGKTNLLEINWIAQLFTVMQGAGTTGPNSDFRATIDIQILEHPITNSTSANVQALFRVYNAWPTAVAYADLDAGANQLFISQLSLAHEGFTPVLAGGVGSDASPPPSG